MKNFLFGNVNDYLIIKLRNGLKFFSNGDTADMVVIIENFDNESKYDYFLERHQVENPTIIDIGANIGSFSIFAAKKYPHSKILCYEPDLKNFKVLKKNLKINNINSVNAYNKAVSKTNEIIKLYPQEDGKFGTVAVSTVRPRPTFTEVQSITLEKIFEDNDLDKCDLLKIDCEGAEYEILFNSTEELFKKIKLISIEYHNLKNFRGEDLKSFLENMHFHVSLKPIKRNMQAGYIYTWKNS